MHIVLFQTMGTMSVQWGLVILVHWLSLEFVVKGWVFNIYIHNSIIEGIIWIATCITIITSTIQTETVIWNRPPHQPIGKRWSSTAWTREMEAFIKNVFYPNQPTGLFEWRVHIAIFLDKYGAPHNNPWNRSFGYGILNLIHRHTQDRSGIFSKINESSRVVILLIWRQYCQHMAPMYGPSMQELVVRAMQQNYKSAVFDDKPTLGISNIIIFYNLKSILLPLSID